jgi:hypothetical protein
MSAQRAKALLKKASALSSQVKANVLTALIVLALTLACAHSYGLL